ncbi:Rz1-like lysis system protein LysC [Yersinia sp. 2540 StPb PI]|uniref:Rz1-like lysis system protein LysC n=1 Tax=Yersinia sp. 2540 StPb PI TaxID=3117406 RepID=UPI003FA4507C
MKVKIGLSGFWRRRQMISVLFSACLTLALTSCASKSVPRPATTCPLLLPPESALTQCEVPEFVGTTWGDSGLYALALKRELRICKGRLDEIISWRQNAGRKT